MVCPICITTAAIAYSPVIASGIGGVLASKYIYQHRQKQQLTKPCTPSGRCGTYAKNAISFDVPKNK